MAWVLFYNLIIRILIFINFPGEGPTIQKCTGLYSFKTYPKIPLIIRIIAKPFKVAWEIINIVVFLYFCIIHDMNRAPGKTIRALYGEKIWNPVHSRP